LTETDDEDVSCGIALREELGAAGVAHHNADFVVVLERLRGEIAEHAQVAMLAMETVFGSVMRVKRRHTLADDYLEV